MSRAHAEIARLIRRLGRVVDALDGERPDPSEILEVRRLLYGLHAILRLHFAQEEEGYFSLLGDPTGPITESPAPTSPEAPRVEGSKPCPVASPCHHRRNRMGKATTLVPSGHRGPSTLPFGPAHGSGWASTTRSSRIREATMTDDPYALLARLLGRIAPRSISMRSTGPRSCRMPPTSTRWTSSA